MNGPNEGEYLANPPGPCCMKGLLHKGEPRGTYETIADVETYVVKPAEGSANGHILLYYADIWGMYVNGCLVMDSFADAGYLVLGLDYFRADPIWKHRKDRNDTSNPDFDYQAWLAKHMAYADVTVPKWNAAARSQYGKPDTKYVCVGYCFGAPYVCDALADETVVAGAFAHPAFLKDRHFTNIKKPLFLSCCEFDFTFTHESRRKALDMLQEGKKTWELQLFSGIEHGFALRGDMDKPYERYVKEASFKGITNWFDFWVSQ